ncbi:MAG: SH3 domain-containing protein [Aggregatilineaceae bacterium]
MVARTLMRFVLLVWIALALPLFGIRPVEAQGGADATVIPDQLNLRSGPGTEYSLVAKLARGTALTLLGRDDVPANGLWLYARTGEGLEGWALSDYLEVRADLDLETLPVRPAPAATAAELPVGGFPEGTGIPAQTSAAVNLRVGPGTGYRVITTLSAGLAALAKGRDAAAQWVFVTVNGQDGWVYVTYLRLLSGDVSALPVVDTIATVTAGGAAPATGGVAVPAPVTRGPGLSSFGYGGHVDSFAYPDLMRYAGMTWVKRQIRFSWGAPGSIAAGAIEQAHVNGFKILLGVVGNANDVIQPGYFEEYARFVGEVAALGPDAIEVWNEQNIDREWAHGHIDPASYTQMLALAYNAIKSANPGVAVISGAPAPTGAEGAFGTDAVWNDDRYVRGMAAAGAARYMDCLGAHYNEGIVPPSQTSGDPRGNYYTRYFWGMVNTYYSAFGGARPVCFTELGYLSPEGLGPLPAHYAWGADTSVAEQARWLADAVRLARNSGRVRLVIIWNVDFTNYGGDPMAGYAIIRPGGSCPACDALAGR